MASPFVLMVRTTLALLLLVPLTAQDPALPSGTVEVHGHWRTGTSLEAFWLRLLPPDARFGGHRKLTLVYAPPPPALLGGTHLADCPFLLVDDAGRLLAWNERTGHGTVTRRGGVYQVQRDRTVDDMAYIALQDASVAPAPAWDLTVAPVLLALAWSADSRATVPVVDLHGGQPAAAVAWNRTEVSLAGRALRATAGADGRLRRLQDARTGEDVVVIEARTESSP